MRGFFCFALLLLPIAALPVAARAAASPAETLLCPGLSQPVEIVKDRWGISHIYAKSEADLFFAQGYNVARDRLFQLEMWRRQATGTVAEILGKKELERDIGNRLFLFRGDLSQELNWYHPHGAAIIRGVCRRHQRLYRGDREESSAAYAGIQDARHPARQVDARRRHLAF